MNIFILDSDPVSAAQQHCDKHVVKMILEYSQMLSTAHHILSESKSQLLLKSTHINHPCSKWVRESSANYQFTYQMLKTLLSEYTSRYGKVHKFESNGLFQVLKDCPSKIPSSELTKFAQAMPEHFRSDDAINSYRNYYLQDKSRFAKWKNGNIPMWWR